ncbi:sigma-54 interaction domain-containing protein [Lentibacillus jeotgali]|uniref:sigma-54 interaction domain-containing protein n=1 Tax=Lentibacillus jeotgali TaxID=558169 RepID=UPI00026283E0|nr:sigma 54-interacting transcriptional regulator [Lentibacillus jeotgali]
MKNLEKIKELNRELEDIFEYSFEGILLTDADGNIIMLNNVSASFLRMTKEEALSKNIKDLEVEGLFNPSAVVRVIEEGRQIELVQKSAGGGYVYARAKPVYDEKGNMKRVISFTRDLTEIMNLRQQLEEMEGELNKYKRNIHDQTNVEGIISRSEEMKKTLYKMKKVAAIDSDVLLLGETGVGKSKIAKVIHQFSKRKDQPFYVINCATLPDSLIEVELFGYTEGMFTGGSPGGKKGLFKSANGGTLFLDEIGELPVHMQARLLHVLQEKVLRPVGSIEQQNIDVRVMSATNRDLKKAVEEGTFREDLYHRLNIFPIIIPSLKDRKEDILGLTKHFLEEHNKTYNKQVRLSPKVLEIFLSYTWEGNVRELRNLIERLVVMTDDPVVKKEDLPEHMGVVTHSKGELTLKEIIEKVEKNVINEVYGKVGSSYKVAESLGISQSAATRKIKKYIKQKKGE